MSRYGIIVSSKNTSRIDNIENKEKILINRHLFVEKEYIK